ncbi:MAG: NADH-ubiquinone oxidoreductase chain L [uncultured Cytophagales bacterium]|uniref:NADH-ubiquinone oxidoreductase chain L n=1 Tax=uncultured Cytophagales bacterium TaxID=158755 RepID=A0A6J4HDV6_9SPHI|nr:MAG: NADH-ubiquinone oxidoreductase chain L [uncultured Cytophagales bacterium]
MGTSLPTLLLLAIPLLPLLAFGLLAGFGRYLPRQGDWLACGLTAGSFAAALAVFAGMWPDGEWQAQADWFHLASHSFRAGLWADRHAALMGVLVTGVSLLVQLFSVGYMRGEPRYGWYFACLGLFTGAMLGVVLADNLFLLYACWELVGLSSYLLIGFWFTRPDAAVAARNAFFINRLGDVGFLLALMLVFILFGSSDLRFLTREALLPRNTSWSLVVGLGLFCGTVAKSAQFPLQLWLPGAMAGPTPVSALIHAATMVAAGVYLLLRVFPLLDVPVLTVIAAVGAVTAFMGAVAALSQTDIKRVLAFSTISQLGYMVMAVGVGAPGAAMLHLVTHAFFKAGLFLCAGSVIHALHGAGHHAHAAFDAQDMRRMGGLRRKLPVTFACYTLCGLALAGLPLFSGFLSKDAILAATLDWAAGTGNGAAGVVPLLGFGSALLTAVYVGRQLLLVFAGPSRLGHEGAYGAITESPAVMRGPMLLLAALSLFLPFSFNPLDAGDGWLLPALDGPAAPGRAWHAFTLVVSGGLAVLGLGIGYLSARRPHFRAPAPLRALSYRNWFLDDAFRLAVVAPGKIGARLARLADQKGIDALVNLAGVAVVVGAHLVSWLDRYVVDGAVRLVVFVTGRVGLAARSRNGRVQTYFAVALSVFLLALVWLLLG